MKFIDSSITAPRGISAAGISCGIKGSGKKDLCLLQVSGLGLAAAVYTQNQVKGHSLKRSLGLSRSGGRFHAVVINSGNANACVGPQGDADAREMADAAAEKLGIRADEVLTCSTGVIGERLPMNRLISGIDEAAALLSHDIDAGHDACEAIMTTDTVRKEAVVEIEIGGKPVTVAGMAKGSGMIHPNMATMIAVITTDCIADQDFLDRSLRETVNKTFNRVSVDGDTSVCDTAILISSGLASNEPIGFEQDKSLNEEARTFVRALEAVCMKLARSIAADGEGAGKLIDVRVDGAPDAETAKQVALSVARSPLVKTAMFGEDPNWGRILTAVGYAPVEIQP